MRLLGVLAGVVCLTSIVLAGTTPAIATSTGGSKFCGQLVAIRTANEAPPPSSDPTHGEAGLALLAKRYDKLERLAPSADIRRRLVEARPLLGHGLVSFTREVRAAIPSAQKLRRAVRHTCDIDVGDVFKVGFP